MSNIGLKIISKVLLLEAKIPTGRPINIQKITAVKIMASVVIVSDHKSTRSIKSIVAKVKSANLIPFVLKEKKQNKKTIKGNGTKFKKLSKLFNTLSIGKDIFLNNGLCSKSQSLIFFSIHSPTGK